MKRFNELVTSLVEAKITQTKPSYDRQAFLSGDLVKIGDIVESAQGQAEVIGLGPNYVTLIKDGKVFKSWVSDITPLNEEAKQKNPRLYKESISYKGYKTKNFTRELAEGFKSVDIKPQDTFAFFNCLMAVDQVLGATKESVNESYSTYKVAFDRANKYVTKFNLPDAFLSECEDWLLEKSIVEGLDFTARSKTKVASLIGSTAGVSLSESPEDIVNSAVKFYRSQRLTNEGWEFVGALLNHATRVGIKWENTFHPVVQRYMGLK